MVEKYTTVKNPIDRIANDVPDLLEITLVSLREMFVETIVEVNPSLERAIMFADSVPIGDQEQPEAIRKMLFCDYLVLYLDRLASTLERCTYGGYKYYVHGRIYDFFHSLNVTVEDLRPGHIEAYYRKLATKDNLHQNSIKHHHTIIRKALQQLYVKQTILCNAATCQGRVIGKNQGMAWAFRHKYDNAVRPHERKRSQRRNG